MLPSRSAVVVDRGDHCWKSEVASITYVPAGWPANWNWNWPATLGSMLIFAVGKFVTPAFDVGTNRIACWLVNTVLPLSEYWVAAAPPSFATPTVVFCTSIALTV